MQKHNSVSFFYPFSFSMYIPTPYNSFHLQNINSTHGPTISSAIIARTCVLKHRLGIETGNTEVLTQLNVSPLILRQLHRRTNK